MSMSIVPMTPARQSRWDTYVSTRPDATLFHTIAWKRVVEREFHCSSRYLLAEEDGEIRGVLPLFLFANRVVGRTLISTPFAVYGGVCASDSRSRDALLRAACELAREEKVEYLELRQRDVCGFPGLVAKQLYVSFDQELPADHDVLLKGLPRDTRYMIRKGVKSELQSTDGQDQFDIFYNLYAVSVRNLGTPVFSQRFFRVLQEEFGDRVETMVVWRRKEPLAAVLSFTYRDCILPYYGGSTAAARQFAANNYMYYELMKSAIDRGFRHFDFGRSKINSGSYAFKTQWNMRERPLPYEYLLVRRKEMPNYSPTNPRLKLAISMWKHVPLPVTKAIGPALVRLFP
jgi:FemAB-related protein (PEP-CTERM system-associated)